MPRRLRTILALLCAAVLTAAAQGVGMEPQSMVLLPTEPDGNRDKRLANIEIVFDRPLNGAAIAKDSKSNAAPGRTATPLKLYAVSLATPQRPENTARNLTVVHADYPPCTIDFAAAGLDSLIQPGCFYRITVNLPPEDLVRANSAFAALKLDEARAAYARYLDSGHGKYDGLAKNRIELCTKLAAHVQELDKHTGLPSVPPADKAGNKIPAEVRSCFLLRKAAEELYSGTGSMRAYNVYARVSRLLSQTGWLAAAENEPVRLSSLAVDSVHYNERDRQAFSDTSLPSVNGAPYYSWLWVNLPLDSVTFSHPRLYGTPQRIDGKWRVYVAPGPAGKLTVSHPDYRDLTVNMPDHGIDEIPGASVIRIDLAVPPAELTDADKAFANLDIAAARLLYDHVIQNGNSYSPDMVTAAAVSKAKVVTLQNTNIVGRWNDLRTYLRTKPEAPRKTLAAKCDTLVSLARQLDAIGVPGMEQNISFYTARSNDYRNTIYLTFTTFKATDRGEHILQGGQPVPDIYRRLTVELSGGGHKVTRTVRGNKNSFALFLTPELSDWLKASSKNELKITLLTPDGRKLDADYGGKLKFDPGNLNLAATLFVKQK